MPVTGAQAMMDKRQFYIDGAWVEPAASSTLGIVNPATEEEFARISLGSRHDVDRAAKAARCAFTAYSEVASKSACPGFAVSLRASRHVCPNLRG